MSQQDLLADAADCKSGLPTVHPSSSLFFSFLRHLPCNTISKSLIMNIVSKSSFDEYNAQLQELALKATKHAALLPPDLAFHRSMGKDIARDIDSCSSRVLTMANQLLDLISATEGSKSSKGKERARLENEDDVVDDFQSMVVGAVDRILENAVGNLSFLPDNHSKNVSISIGYANRRVPRALQAPSNQRESTQTCSRQGRLFGIFLRKSR